MPESNLVKARCQYCKSELSIMVTPGAKVMCGQVPCSRKYQEENRAVLQGLREAREAEDRLKESSRQAAIRGEMTPEEALFAMS